MEIDNEYCEKHCKGYRDTGGRCFSDGRCDAYWKYQKQKGTMNEKKIMQRAKAVAEQFSGCEVMEAVDVLGEALVIAAKKEPTHAVIVVYYIGKLIEEMNGRSALVKIEDDGRLSFSIGADGVKQDIF